MRQPGHFALVVDDHVGVDHGCVVTRVGAAKRDIIQSVVLARSQLVICWSGVLFARPMFVPKLADQSGISEAFPHG